MYCKSGVSVLMWVRKVRACDSFLKKPKPSSSENSAWGDEVRC